MTQKIDRSARPIVLSLKPQWSDAILCGTMTIEIRRKFRLGENLNLRSLIYTSSPIKALCGEMTITKSRRLSIEDIWLHHGPSTGVSRDLLDEYLGDLGHGTLLFLRDPIRYAAPIPLTDLRLRHNFVAPQSFSYATEGLLSEVAP